jgi:tRNA uridine 5-carboxymethylaminomethyl modification enzyme
VLRASTIGSGELVRRGINVKMDGAVHTAYSLLGHPGVALWQLEEIFEELRNIDERTRESLIIDSLYDPYLERQSENAEMLEREKQMLIPANFDYDAVGGLTNEVREKLKLHRPYSLEVASRIAGLTPAGLVNVMVALKNLHPKD